MTRDSKRFLPPEAVARISRLELQARTVVEGFLSGLHKSPYFGQSVEFVQHREYVPGDDPRRIDWKAWSKTDKYYIKQYEEETNLRCTLLVDVSESMQFGSGKQTKYDYACGIAACISYLLLRQQDSVGLITFADAVRTVVPTRSKRNHLNDILASLDAGKPAEKTDMYGILAKVADQQTQRGMIVVVSDLLTPRDSLFKGLQMLRHRGHDVMVLHVLDDQELDFDYNGTTKFEGLEAMGELTCDPRSLREGYLEAVKTFLEEVRRKCAGATIDYQTVRTSEKLDAVLAHYVNHRLGMRQSVRR
ncbi:MAG: DUF58 domain-containing protein [Planctomycetota bacterium]|nr:DUF58 domain-containing protein [Planctomycetota bacterium]